MWIALVGLTHASAVSFSGVLDPSSEVAYDASAGPSEAWRGVAPATLEGFTFNEEDVTRTRFEIRVATADFVSNNPLRDRSARLVTFESGRYPFVSFLATTVATEGPVEVPAGAIRTVDVTGRLELHGVQKILTVPVTVTREGDALLIEGGFDVLLADYEMRAPSIWFRSVDELVRVSFDLTINLTPR